MLVILSMLRARQFHIINFAGWKSLQKLATPNTQEVYVCNLSSLLYASWYWSAALAGVYSWVKVLVYSNTHVITAVKQVANLLSAGIPSTQVLLTLHFCNPCSHIAGFSFHLEMSSTSSRWHQYQLIAARSSSLYLECSLQTADTWRGHLQNSLHCTTALYAHVCTRTRICACTV